MRRRILALAACAAMLFCGFRAGNADGAVRLGTSLVLMLVLLGIAVVSYYERVDLVVVPLLLAALRLHGQAAEDGTKLWNCMTRCMGKQPTEEA